MASNDESKLSKDFQSELRDIVSHGNTCIMIAMGFDLGLFDVLAKLQEPKNSQEIAAASGMKERYIREWLGAMVTAKIVNVDATGESFYLQAHRVPYLTKDGGSRSLSIHASLLANLTKNAFEKVKASFSEAGPPGTMYDDYPGKSSITSECGMSWMKNHLASSFVTLFPVVKTQLEAGINVIDLGCGMGTSTCTLSRAFPKSTFHGVDFLEINFHEARKRAEEESLKNCKFLEADISKLPDEWAAHFQYAFMHNVFHDMAHPMDCLAEIRRVLSPGGMLSIIDCHGHAAIKDNIDTVPGVEILYATSLLACLPMSLGVGGAGLGAVCGIERVKDILDSAGFELLHSGLIPECQEKHYYLCKMI